MPPVDMALLGLGLLAFFALLMVVFRILAAARRASQTPALRPIEAYQAMPDTLARAIETGGRLHVSLGTAGIGQANTAAALAGLSVLDQVAGVAVVSDRPPIVTTADGAAMLMAQDVLRRAYARQNALARYDHYSAQTAGLTPMSFGAAQTTLQRDGRVAASLLFGAGDSEAVLLVEAARRDDITTLAGVDNPAGQAMLFAGADHPLVGEDMFAAGAYIDAAPAHLASLRAQDMLRLLLGVAIVSAVVVRTASDVLARLVGR